MKSLAISMIQSITIISNTYSPYDNIIPQSYPAILVRAGLYDNRVPYEGVLRWATKLRSLKTDNNPLLVRFMNAGHTGTRYYNGKDSMIENTVFLLNMHGYDVQENKY